MTTVWHRGDLRLKVRTASPNLIVLICVSSPATPTPELSILERRVLRLVALRRSRRQIAALLGQTTDRVEQCQTALKRKAAVTTLHSLRRWARTISLCRPGDRLSPLEQSQRIARRDASRP